MRPHLATISSDAWDLFERAVIAIKASGVYDRYVAAHTANRQNAHGGSNFLVWHRAFLWEFEVDLDRAVPGARIPWYDWSSVPDTALTNPVWDANRLGSCNVGAPGPIADGPFTSFDASLTRDGDVTESIPSRQFITNALDTNLEYAAFNNWLEGVHASFHIAVGGSMSTITNSPRDPVFFMHHAYIDMVYREWQNRGGGNQFTGEHSGAPVTAETVMTPFGRTAGSVINGISNCVQYSGSPSIAAVSRQQSGEGGELSGGNGDIVPRISKTRKLKLQLRVARKKVDDADGYKTLVDDAVKQKEACKAAALKWGMSEEQVEAYERTQSLVELEQGVDISEPEVVEESAAEVAEEGSKELVALEKALESKEEAREDAEMKSKKWEEDAMDTVATY